MVRTRLPNRQEEQSVESMIRAVLRKMAHVHHGKQSAERKAEVRKSFYELDTSGDGRISLEEFLESTAEVVSNSSNRVVAKIFSCVDEDKSGFLEFDEFLVATFIMEAGFQICDNCLAPVIMAGYTCKTCWSQRVDDEADDTFDLCASCYIAEGFDHPASHELVDTCHMYHYLLTSTSPPQDSTSNNGQVQCTICEEYHTKDLKSFLLEDGTNHVVEIEGTHPEEFVCEWCASYMCGGCGKYFSEPSYDDLRSDQWLRKDLWCDTCDTERNFKPNVASLLKRLRKSEIPKNCSTCAKNLGNGTLGEESKAQQGSNGLVHTDLITARMANNLLLQQSYFNASMMASCGAALSNLA